jgi:hypothetical protein
MAARASTSFIKHSSFVRLAAALTALLALAPGPARAQPRDPLAGEALFQEGRRLRKAGEIAAACEKLAESERLDPAAGTLANLAGCEEELGRIASAWQHWREVADQLPASDKRRPRALERAARLEQRLPRLIITLAASAPGDAEVRRDGVPLGAASLGVPLPADPGRHVVVVSARGRPSRSFEVMLAPGEQQVLSVEPAAAPAPRPVPSAVPAAPSSSAAAVVLRARPEPASSPRGRLSGPGPLLLGVGAAALAAGAYFGLQALAARREASRWCAEGAGARRCWASAERALARDRRFSLYADVGLGVGALAAGTGLYFLLRSPRQHTVAVAGLVPAAGGAEVQLAARF